MPALTKFVISTTIIATFFASVSAQEAAVTTAAPVVDSAQTVSVTVADINLTDVVFKDEGGSISGQFALQGKMGKQNDIVYGVMVYDAKGKLIDATKLGEVASVQEGQIVRNGFSYTIPPYIHGTGLTFMLVAETKGGLPLGAQPLSTKKEIPGKVSTLSCANKDGYEITCTSTVDTTLTTTYSIGTIFGEVAATESIDVKKGVATKLSPTLKAGKYYVRIVTKDNTAVETLTLVVKGAYGSIQNIVVTEKSSGLLSVVSTLSASPSKGIQVRTVLNDGATVCGQTESDGSMLVAEQEVKTSCTKGTATITLLSADGVVLGTKTSPFETKVYVAPTQTQPKRDMTMTYVYGVLAVILLIIFGLIMKAAKKSVQ